MEHLDPKNELIDLYLRDELSGEALVAFEKQMQEDDMFRAEVEVRKLIAESIHQYGAAELKNFIRTKTKRKSFGIIKINTWYYAAAAVGLILIGSFAAIYSIRKNSPVPAVAISNDSIKKEGIPETGIASESMSEKNQKEAVSSENDKSAEATADTANYEQVVIADNITVVPITIMSRTDEPVNMEQTMPVGVRKPANTEAEGVKIADSSKKVNKTEIPAESIRKIQMQFLITRDAEPALQFSTGQSATDVLKIFNIAPDNPLILKYNGKYFLQTGGEFYEIRTEKTDKQEAMPVKDVRLKKELNK